MNRGAIHFWLFFAIVLALFESGHSIRCYQCTSRRDPKCLDPMIGEMRPTECTRESVSSTLNEITYAVRGSPGIADIFSGSTFSCLKINSVLNNQFHNMTTIRGCYYEHMDGRDLCTMLKTKVIDQSALPFCETCNGDACNGSGKLTFTAAIFLPILAIYYLISQ